MKTSLLTGSFLLFSLLSFGQNETYKNTENSDYAFKKIVHLDATPVQSQGMTGTCWSFSALSFFESELIRKGIKNPDALSEMYVVRKAYESKADKYIRMDGKTNFGEGGAFHDVPFVINQFGIVPEGVYNGLNYGNDSHDHSELSALLTGAMNGVLSHVQQGSGISAAWKKALSGILDAYLGPDPTSFEWKGKKYTPKSYANELGLKMDDYVSLTSFTNHDMYKQCELAIPDNWGWGKSYNIGLTDLVDACEYALKNGYTLAWGADVSEKGFSFRNGIAIAPEDPSTIDIKGRDNKNFSDAGAEKSSNAFLSPQTEMTITPEIRQEGYDGKTTTDDHGMHIVGLYTDQKGTRYFLVKNSWGTGNYPKGYLYVSEAYFKWKTINIYLHKGGISQDLKKKLNL